MIAGLFAGIVIINYMCERLTTTESKIARQRATRIIKDVQTLLSDKYIFCPRLVGSVAWGTAIKDDKGEYDLDYQLLLTPNSPEYIDNQLSNPAQIKNDFLKAFIKASTKHEIIENSTTAITLINKDNKPFHIDFVIIKQDENGFYIIRRNNKIHSSVNEFTWNQLPKYQDAYAIFKSLKPEEKQYLIEKIIIPMKQKEKAKKENDPTKVSSCALFIREVNNYYANRRRNR